MFIRFVSGEIDEDSHLSAGLFRAAYKLLNELWLPEYEYDALRDPMNWFNEHLESPYDYRLEPAWLADSITLLVSLHRPRTFRSRLGDGRNT